MITSVFSKSKPINFLIVFFIALAAFIIAIYRGNLEAINTLAIVKLILQFACIYFSVLVLNFIIEKNNLSLKNNYEILLFSLFLLLIPQTTTNIFIVLSNGFILLALRKILSMHSKKKIKKKLFDAALLVGIASLFHFWSIIFFVLIFVAILYYAEVDVKNWIVPFLGAFTVYIITTAILLLINEDFFNIDAILPRVSLDLTQYNSLNYVVSITMLVSFGIWSSLFYLKDIRKKKRTYRPSYKIVFAASIIATFIVIVSPEKNGSEFLFLFAPLAIIITSYTETIEDKWFKEVFLLCIFIIPLVLLTL